MIYMAKITLNNANEVTISGWSFLYGDDETDQHKLDVLARTIEVWTTKKTFDEIVIFAQITELKVGETNLKRRMPITE